MLTHFLINKSEMKDDEALILIKSKIDVGLNLWIEKRYFLSCDMQGLDNLADFLDVSTEQLSYYFSTVKNTSYKHWRTSLRIDYVKQLIENNPDISIADLRREIGIKDKNSFKRVFTDYTKYTPSEYKALCKQKQSHSK